MRPVLAKCENSYVCNRHAVKLRKDKVFVEQLLLLCYMLSDFADITLCQIIVFLFVYMRLMRERAYTHTTLVVSPCGFTKNHGLAYSGVLWRRIDRFCDFY